MSGFEEDLNAEEFAALLARADQQHSEALRLLRKARDAGWMLFVMDADGRGGMRSFGQAQGETGVSDPRDFLVTVFCAAGDLCVAAGIDPVRVARAKFGGDDEEGG